MKKALMLASLLASVGVMAQGSLLLTNGGGGANAPIYDTDGVTKMAKESVMVAIYVAPTEAAVTDPSLAPVIAPALLNKPAGLFNFGQVELAGLKPGTKPYVRIDVWDKGFNSWTAAYNAAAKVGSVVFQLGLPLGGDPGTGEPPITTPGLVGMTPVTMYIIPEPSVLALIGLGVAAFLLRRRN